MTSQINHPLDCPICDQGGECDLQDQVLSCFQLPQHSLHHRKRPEQVSMVFEHSPQAGQQIPFLAAPQDYSTFDHSCS